MRTREIERNARKFINEAIKSFNGQVMDCDQEDPYLKEYIGTVFNILPSGKYYMPWACSNLDPCPTCKGSGKKKKPVPCPYCSGKGIRFVSDLPFPEESNDEKLNRVLKSIGKVISSPEIPLPHYVCNVCKGEKEVQESCLTCDGTGSREAYEDQIYMKILEQVSEKKGFWIESGEGDPCDLFLCTSV